MPHDIVFHRLSSLRKVMTSKQIDAWVVLTSDPHLSEYIPDYWKTIEFLSGFTGSAGVLVVTLDKIGLWTDSRYWEQAKKQLLGTSIQLFEATKHHATHWDWVLQQLNTNQCIGLDGNTLSYHAYLTLQQRAKYLGITLKLDEDIIKLVWQDRPTLPKNPVYVHDKYFVALTCQEKIKIIRSEMQRKNADYHLISSLDDIAWITNLRGSDIAYNPVFLAHLLIGLAEVILFVNIEKIPTTILTYLQMQGITIDAYGEAVKHIARLSHITLLVDQHKVSYGILTNKSIDISLQHAINPSTCLKARKTQFELDHIREAMIQDGIALCQFFYWLDKAICAKKIISELDVAEELDNRRAKQNNFISLSFNTIAGFNANSALPHYTATQESCAVLDGDGILLVDSGAQYLNGTTDITRVVAINRALEAQKQDFTMVLKSHIAMASLIYPEGIQMPLLDSVGRSYLWQHHLDFRHGTGHGVGYFLNVHEGPQVLSYYADANEATRAYAGMVTSIEPGLYHADQWGVRIENLVASTIHPSNTDDKTYGNFLFFDTLTLCPIDKRLIQTKILTASEKLWLNRYHAMVRQSIAAHLTLEEQTWLNWATDPIV